MLLAGFAPDALTGVGVLIDSCIGFLGNGMQILYRWNSFTSSDPMIPFSMSKPGLAHRLDQIPPLIILNAYHQDLR